MSTRPLRRQLPVLSPVRLRTIVHGSAAALSRGAHGERVSSELRRRFGANTVLLTDSGTSALVAALLAAAGRGGIVALPTYACIDLAAAAVAAGVRVRLYDVDPHTLSADLDSLSSTLKRGVDAVVAVHLYGYPADIPAIAALCQAAGVHLIEDAAQAEGATLDGRPLGGFGPLSVLSFGRGKGVTGGSGGALIARAGAPGMDSLHALLRSVPSPSSGVLDVLRAGAQWALGRPSVYWLPAMIPALKLGEMVYNPAGDVARMSRAAAAMVEEGLRTSPVEVALRRAHAKQIDAMVERSAHVRRVRAIRGDAGFLRYAVLDDSGKRVEDLRRGIARGYPLTVAEQEPARGLLLQGEKDQPGGLELKAKLFTLPVHSKVSSADLNAVNEWLQSARG